MYLKIKRLSDSAIIPTYAHETDSGMDLYYDGPDIQLETETRAILSIGIAIELSDDTEAQIRSRSGLAAKQGLFVLNSPGTIDQGYTGEIKVILYNSDDQTHMIKKGDRIAQMVICPVLRCQITEVNDLKDSDRGVNGFGSTGK